MSTLFILHLCYDLTLNLPKFLIQLLKKLTCGNPDIELSVKSFLILHTFSKF